MFLIFRTSKMHFCPDPCTDYSYFTMTILSFFQMINLFKKYQTTNSFPAHWFLIEENHLVLRLMRNPAKD